MRNLRGRKHKAAVMNVEGAVYNEWIQKEGMRLEV